MGFLAFGLFASDSLSPGHHPGGIGSSLLVDCAVRVAEAPAPVNALVRDSASRVVKIGPKTATPNEAPTSPKQLLVLVAVFYIKAQ